MKKLTTLLLTIIISTLCTFANENNFDEKLKRFITITNDEYVPEISLDEAIKLGFSVNDYNSFVRYTKKLNTNETHALTMPENAFIGSFIEYHDGKFTLKITQDRTLKAGATIEGYRQTLQMVEDHNKNLTEQDKKEYLPIFLGVQSDLIEYAKQNPDKSAVKEFQKSIKECYDNNKPDAVTQQ